MENDKLPKTINTNSEMNRFIEFSLAKEDYAIPLLIVREVISVPITTPIPNSASHFLGIMNIRGQVISIIDLRKLLKVKSSEVREDAVIIIEINGTSVGIVVDSINKVLAFAPDEVGVIPEIENQVNVQYILGVYKKESSLTILLDIEKALNLKTKTSIDESKLAG